MPMPETALAIQENLMDRYGRFTIGVHLPNDLREGDLPPSPGVEVHVRWLVTHDPDLKPVFLIEWHVPSEGNVLPLPRRLVRGGFIVLGGFGMSSECRVPTANGVNAVFEWEREGKPWVDFLLPGFCQEMRDVVQRKLNEHEDVKPREDLEVFVSPIDWTPPRARTSRTGHRTSARPRGRLLLRPLRSGRTLG